MKSSLTDIVTLLHSLYVNNKLHSQVKDLHLCPVSLSAENVPKTNTQPMESASQVPACGPLSGYQFFRRKVI